MMPKRRARPKKKANRKMVVSESLESSVAMSEAAASTTDEELNLCMVEAGPSRVQNEARMEEDVEPLEERTATVSLSLPPSERMQSMKREEVP